MSALPRQQFVMRLSQHVRTVNNPDGGVLLDLQRGKMFRLNATGSTILELLVRGCAEEYIAAEISKRYGVELALASTDVQDFLASLKKNELIDEPAQS
jgi:Coenzyme PQQ synthesis protein D (PqqD)